MRPDDPIRAVLLDVGGVMLVPDPAKLGAILRAHGGGDDPGEVLRAHYGAMNDADDGTTFDWRRYYGRLLARAGVPVDRAEVATADVAAAFTAENIWYHVLDGVHEALATLARQGRPLAIVSNSDGTVEQVLWRTRLCQLGLGPGVPVAAMLDSYVVGVAKPDPRIFHMALDRLGVPAEQAVHVGDTRAFDVAGAAAAGVRPVHVDPYGDCPGQGEHPHVRGLADVTDLLVAA